jgi:hypothetical protein
MIALLCPSRGRPDKLKRMWQSALQTAHNPDRLFLHLGIHAEESASYMHALSTVSGSAKSYTVNDWSTVFSYNVLAIEAKKYDAKLFMVLGDDTLFSTPHWDKAVLDHYNDLENKIQVYALRDSRDLEGTPHPIMTGAFMDAMGYLLPPIFLHWYVDSWVAEIAKANSCFTHLKDYMLIHEKPSDKGQGDETHTRIRLRGWQERDKFVDEKCRHFLAEEKTKLRLIMQQAAGLREHAE